jgi:hypothetical protein
MRARRPAVRASRTPTIPTTRQDRAIRPPRPRPVAPAERAFLALGPGAEAWLIAAASAGAVRIRSKMARAVELAAILGGACVDEALALAASAGRFADGDLASICDHLAAHDPGGDTTIPDEASSVQPGTGAWAGFGR